MVAILLIIIAGIYFHTLAQKHKENVWLSTSLGVLVYSIPFIILMIFTGLSFFSTGLKFISTLELISIPISIFLTYILRKILITIWESKESKKNNSEIIDDISFD